MIAMRITASRLILYSLLAATAAIFIADPARCQEQDLGLKATPLKAVQRLNRAPVNKEILRVQLPRPSVHKLPNGLTVLVLERHKLPELNLEMWIRPGPVGDPVPGMALFTADMLTEGTKTRTSAQIAAAVDDLGASLDTSATFGASKSRITASGLTDSTENLFDLMSDVILHPTFPAEELEKYKQRELADLEEQLSRPGFLAGAAFRKALYGDTNLGTSFPSPGAVKSLTPEMLAEYHEKYYRPGNAVLGITGDVQTADVLKLVEKYFGSWEAGPALPAAQFRIPAAQPARVVLVDRPGSVQASIIAGNFAIRRTQPDYFSLVVMNQVLGGGVGSRLFLNLREEKGYTYGAYSRVFADQYQGFWNARMEVRNAVTDGSLHELLYEFNRLRNEPVPPEELDEKRRSIVAGFALSLEQPAELLGDWMTVQHFGLPENYWDEYPVKISAVDSAAVQAAARRYIDPDHLQIVCVGDAQQIQGALAKYGKVETHPAPASASP